MAESMYVLFEHAAGFALMKINEFEEIGSLLPQVEASTSEYGRFAQIVKLVSFAPFKSAVVALESINSISEGILPETLEIFIDKNVPKPTKKEKLILGVSDSKLGASINEALGIKCQHTGAVPEIIRGIRMHFHKLVKGFTLKTCGTAQLGLGHSYSRAKVKFNVNRVDNMIIQSIALLDQLDKDVNTFSMRIREWYSYHFPELVKIVPENYMYAKMVQFIKNRKDLSEDSLEGLEERIMDSAKAQTILDAARSSMGMDISPIDLMNIESFASRVISLSDYRKQLAEYLHSKMAGVAPNLAQLIGDQVGARLISHAGSLTNLAKYPASTVQILGAEKALFRALKTRSNTPKYGLLFNSTFIGRAHQKNKGKISRYLANKCSIASRIDCFSESQTAVFGEQLRQQVEDRLKFYETGEKPRPNVEVMTEAQQMALKEVSLEKKKKKKAKKDKKQKMSENGGGEFEESSLLDNSINPDVEENGEPTKKKKKKRKSADINGGGGIEESLLGDDTKEENSEPAKKKKKKKKKSVDISGQD